MTNQPNKIFKIGNQKIKGSDIRPRLSIKRSLKHLWLQLIDDNNHNTIGSFSTKSLDQKLNGVKLATLLGDDVAKWAKSKKITQILLDRGSYRYHGRIKALADSIKKSGIKI